jgi:NAD(P)-dependent dehydrogenase (short-subunit alcohol dehydrogenase family)
MISCESHQEFVSMKVAIITAGGSGMGAAAARRLSQDGYKVAVLSSSGRVRLSPNSLPGSA